MQSSGARLEDTELKALWWPSLPEIVVPEKLVAMPEVEIHGEQRTTHVTAHVQYHPTPLLLSVFEVARLRGRLSCSNAPHLDSSQTTARSVPVPSGG